MNTNTYTQSNPAWLMLKYHVHAQMVVALRHPFRLISDRFWDMVDAETAKSTLNNYYIKWVHCFTNAHTHTRE